MIAIFSPQVIPRVITTSRYYMLSTIEYLLIVRHLTEYTSTLVCTCYKNSVLSVAPLTYSLSYSITIIVLNTFVIPLANTLTMLINSDLCTLFISNTSKKILYVIQLTSHCILVSLKLCNTLMVFVHASIYYYSWQIA